MHLQTVTPTGDSADCVGVVSSLRSTEQMVTRRRTAVLDAERTRRARAKRRTDRSSGGARSCEDLAVQRSSQGFVLATPGIVQAITRGGPRWPDTLYEPRTQPRARGASSKRAGAAASRTLEQLIKKIGGNLEAFYFAFGEDDVYVIADLPDNVTAAAVGLTVSRLGFRTGPAPWCFSLPRRSTRPRRTRWSTARRGREAGVPDGRGRRHRVPDAPPVVAPDAGDRPPGVGRDAGGWTASRTSSPLWPGTPPAAADPPMRRRVGACLSMRMRWQRGSAPQGSNAHTSSASAGWAGSLSPEETAIEVPALLLPAFCSM